MNPYVSELLTIIFFWIYRQTSQPSSADGIFFSPDYALWSQDIAFHFSLFTFIGIFFFLQTGSCHGADCIAFRKKYESWFIDIKKNNLFLNYMKIFTNLLFLRHLFFSRLYNLPDRLLPWGRLYSLPKKIWILIYRYSEE